VAVTFVANALGSNAATTSFSITLPATASGDIIILEYTHRGTGDATLGGTYSGPAFAEKHDQQYATSTFSGKTCWSRATGDHSGQTVTGSGLTNSCAAIVTVYRGAVASGDPLADATIVGEQNASANETQAGITTATNGCYVVLVVVNSPDVSVTSPTMNGLAAMTNRAELLSTGGTDTSIMHADIEKYNAGATGSFTWAQTDGAGGSWAYAIEPEPTDFGAVAGNAITTLEAVPPGNITTGDPVLARVVHNSASVTTTPPTGWTLLSEGNPADFTSYLYELDDPWTGSEDLTFTFSSSVNASIDLYRHPGYTVGVVGTVSDVAAVNVVSPSVTPAGNNHDVLAFGDCDATGVARTWTVSEGGELLDRADFPFAELHRVMARRTLVGGSGTPTTTTLTVTGSVQDLSGVAITLVAAAGGGGTATPAVIARSFAVNAPTSVSGGGSTSPAAIARSVAVNAPTSVSGGGSTSPAVIARSFVLNAPTSVTGGGSTSPAVIPLAITIPQATGAAGGTDGTASPAAVTTTVTMPAPTLSGGGSSSPAVIALTVTLPAPTVTYGGAASPAVTALAAASPAPTAAGGGSTSPAAIARSVTLPAPTPSGGGSTSPAVSALAATLPAPTLSGGGSTAPAVIPLAVDVRTATGSGTGTGTGAPGVIARSFTLPAPTVSGGGSTSPAATQLSITVPAAQAGASKTTAPAVIPFTISMPSATASGGGTASPNATALVTVIPNPGVSAGSSVSPATLALAISIAAAIAASQGDDENPITVTVRDQFHTVTVLEVGHMATIRSSHSVTVQENR
jgi:hypothetical protein